MAIDLDALICPRCGSNDIEIVDPFHAVCESCGTKIALSERNNEKEEDDGNLYSEVLPSLTEEEFKRKLLISLAHDKSSEDVYDVELSEIKEIEHKVLLNSTTLELSYSASIGHDREEPYIDYESYYDDKLQKKVQRQVTKYRKVTDWSSISNNYSERNTLWYDLSGYPNFVSLEFPALIYLTNARNPEDFRPIPDPSEERALLTSGVRNSINKQHKTVLDAHVIRTLPGDHYKNYTSSITRTEDIDDTVFSAKGYITTVKYRGKEYTKYAVAHRSATVFGDGFEVSAEDFGAIIAEERKALAARRKELLDRKPKLKKRKWLTIGIPAFLLLSLPFGFFGLGGFFGITMGIISVLGPILGFLFFWKKYSELTAKAASDEAQLDRDQAATEASIGKRTEEHNKRLFEKLNAKLKSLGLKEATYEEVFKPKNKE